MDGIPENLEELYKKEEVDKGWFDALGGFQKVLGDLEDAEFGFLMNPFQIHLIIRGFHIHLNNYNLFIMLRPQTPANNSSSIIKNFICSHFALI